MTTTALAPSDAKAPKAKAPTRRTTAPKAKADITPDPLARVEGEDVQTYVSRLATIGTREALDVAESTVLAADDAARVLTFEDRVFRGYLAGLLAVAETKLRTGTAPTEFKAISKALDVDKDGGDFLGRRYSALREAWRLSVSHTSEAMAAFVAAYREATGGTSPERVREYVQWIDAKSDNYRDAETIGGRLTKAETNAAKARDEAKAKAERTKVLKAAAKVDGVPLTPEQWGAMSEDQLRDVAALATALATAKGEARRKAEREAKANEAKADTGPAPKAKATAKVVS